VEYQVELISFEEAPSTYSMSAAEKKVRDRLSRRGLLAHLGFPELGVFMMAGSPDA
jgi:hypothetical protein